MNKPKVVFAPGCFDNFEGTQEELDSLVAELQRLVESGELLENSQLVNVDDAQALLHLLMQDDGPMRLH